MNYRILQVSICMMMGVLSFAIDGMNSNKVFAGGTHDELRNGDQDEETRSSLNSALIIAAQQGYSGVVRLLLETPDIMKAFHTAIEKDQLEHLNEFLEKGIQLDARNNEGKPIALTLAIENGNKESLKALLLAEAHVVIRGTKYRFRAPAQDKVELSKRRLKVALLSLRYAGADMSDPKLRNTAGDLIVSNEYVRPWFLLSHTGLREDVFIVFLDLLANCKNVESALFRLALNDLGDYLVNKLRAFLREIKRVQSFELEIWYLPAHKKTEIEHLLDPELVEENFGALIRNGIKPRFNDLLIRNAPQGSASAESSSTSQSSSCVKEPGTTSR